MTNFIIRFILFMGIWAFMISQSDDKQLFSMFMFIVSLACFFFLSLRKVPIFLFFLLSGIILLHGFIIIDLLFTALLLVLLAIIALFKLEERQMYFYLGTNFALLVVLAMMQKQILSVLLLGISFVILFILLMQKERENREKKELYDELFTEYRQLKRLNVSTEEIAKAEERTRIAREIHDSVGHQLTALMMKLEMLYIEEKNEKYNRLKEMVSKSLEDTRKAVQTLQDSEAKGITAVVQLIRKLEAESQLLIQFTLKEGVLSIPLSNEHGVVLYRVIQEALTNVMRHATSKQVHITIGKSAIDSLAFKIANPIHVQKPFELGFGLKNMKERVQEIGGKIDIYQTNNQFIIQGILPAHK